jgi:tRNA modification GTPase
MSYITNDTIIALSTPQGSGAIGVIRLSGNDAITILQHVFSKKITEKASHTLHFGTIKNENNLILDEVVVALFRAPKSYTRENVVEISCHGSPFILQQVLALLIRKGARPAQAGEFTLRAFLNGQLDLAQAEAVADLIAAESAAAHQVAMQQMRGGFSAQIKELRQQLIHFASLIELELDFGEEDVEFADRTQLYQLVYHILNVLNKLNSSFQLGNVLKNGVPVAIVGKPNVGKSTLLNALLEEEKAIVSPIAGTTRDVIEDTLNINGLLFRLMDTAGLRDTEDTVEKIGVARTHTKMQEARIILYLCDGSATDTVDSPYTALTIAQEYQEKYPAAKVILVANKIDQRHDTILWTKEMPLYSISAKENKNISALKQTLYDLVYQDATASNEIVTNARHVAALNEASLALQDVITALNTHITSDFIAMDIRRAIHSLGLVVGEVSTDDLLENIFRNFCIGK